MAELGLISLSFLPEVVKKALEVIPDAFEIGWKNWLTFSKNELIWKLAKILTVYVDEIQSTKKIKETYHYLKKQVFKKFDYMEVAKLVFYYKNIKDVFQFVKFNDEYWKNNKYKILTDAYLMRNYLTKKSFIDSFYNKINIKLYNHSPPTIYLNEIYNEIIDLYMEEKYNIKDLKRFFMNFEKELFKNTISKKDKYIEDFEKEQKEICQLIKNATDDNSLPTKFKRGNRELVDIIENIDVKVIVGLSQEFEEAENVVEWMDDKEDDDYEPSIIRKLADVFISKDNTPENEREFSVKKPLNEVFQSKKSNSEEKKPEKKRTLR